jgi:hypothetical protein
LDLASFNRKAMGSTVSPGPSDTCAGVFRKLGSLKEGGGMTEAIIADYIDERGKGTGTLLSLAPDLHIVLVGSERNVRVLSCDCVMVLFGAASFQADWVLERWNLWRRIKQVAETQLAAGGN